MTKTEWWTKTQIAAGGIEAARANNLRRAEELPSHKGLLVTDTVEVVDCGWLKTTFTFWKLSEMANKMKEGGRGELGSMIWRQLQSRGWRQRDLCVVLGTTDNTVSRIMLGIRPLSAAAAKEFGAALDLAPVYLLGAQAIDRLAALEAELIRKGGKAAVSRKLNAIRDRAEQLATRKAGEARQAIYHGDVDGDGAL